MLSEKEQAHFAAEYATDVLRNMVLNIESRFTDWPADDKDLMALMIILGIARGAEKFGEEGVRKIAFSLLRNEGILIEVLER